MKQEKTLLGRERLVALTFSLFIVFVTLYTLFFSGGESSQPLQTVLVKAVGDIEQQGVFELPRGARVQDLLEIVKPFDGAKPRRLKGESRLKQGQLVEIVRPKVKIQFVGALTRPVTLQVVKGATVGEVIFDLPLTPEADVERVKDKKLTRNGQKVNIPRCY